MKLLKILNTQAPEPTLLDNADGAVEVFDIFYTLQGEGPNAGRPAVFVRLYGCTLRCPMCDTDYTSKRKLMTPADVFKKVLELSSRDRLVVLTGGEPFRQPIGRLCELLSDHMDVQIETNGQLFRPGVCENADIVCSPKLTFVHEMLKPRVDSLKYVLDADHVDPKDGLPTEVLGMKAPPCRPWKSFKGEVYVQPADEQDPAKNKRNREAAVASCMKYGYRLSIQQHKLVGLD